jgi:hypothetical protein
MEEGTKKLLAREGIILVFFILPAVVIGFVIYVLFETIEVYSFPDEWTKMGEVIFFVLIFGYLLQLLLRLAGWSIKALKR